MKSNLKGLYGKQCVVVLNSLARQATAQLTSAYGYYFDTGVFTARVESVESQGVWFGGIKVSGGLGSSSIFVPFNAIASIVLAEKGFKRSLR